MYTFSNKLNRKGQLTLFVIVAMLILFSFAFTIYAKNEMMTPQMISQADRQIQEYINANSINQYVTSCLDVVAQEVLIQTMSQGGEFNFTNTNNIIEFNDTSYNRTVNVSIAVDINNNCPDGRNSNQHIVYNEEPDNSGKPDYPYYGGYVKVKNLESKYYNISANYGVGPYKNNCTKYSFNQYSGFFGINNLPRLCNANGANKAGVVSGTNYLTCDYYNNFNKSLQQTIERNIEKEIMNCVNFTDFKKGISSNTNITKIGNATAVLTFKSGGYNIKLVYPFTVIMSNRQPITRKVDFNIEKNIPFKELYEYTYELVNYDVKYAEFSITKNYTNVLSNGWRRSGQNIRLYNYTIDIIKGDINNDYTDIVRVIDTEHKITGVPLTINFAVRERRPVLDYIHTVDNAQFDIVVIENDVIKISPQGYDPDDDNLNYYYTGWLEDYTEKYEDITDECNPPATLEILKEKCIKQNYDDKPHNWTNSEEYKKTKRSANYTTSHKDLGAHQVKITIVDEHGLKDNQIVNILVFDLPEAVINVTPAYPDIPQGWASYEDKFVLNASQSKTGVISGILGSKLNTITWDDKKEPFGIIKSADPDDMKLKLPEDDNKPNILIASDAKQFMIEVINYIFKIITTPTATAQTPNQHNISLTVNETMADLTATTVTLINITECLNHSNPSNKIYPYNDNPNDLTESLEANHTCCTDNLEYATQETSCFESTQYGRIETFIRYKTEVKKDILNPLEFGVGMYGYYSEPGSFRSTDLSDNNIYKQEFLRVCSGDRGNICSGDGTNIIELEYDCNDNNYGTGGDRRCSGPPAANINIYSENSIPCDKYGPGTTFENLIDTTLDGNCNNIKACSPYLYGKYGDGGPNLCVGQCDGQGGCTTAVNCVCDSTTCGASPECDYSASQVGKKCYGGYFEKRCENCMLISDSTICESDLDCKGNPKCDGYTAGSTRTINGIPGGCTTDCEYKPCNKGETYDIISEECIKT